MFPVQSTRPRRARPPRDRSSPCASCSSPPRGLRAPRTPSGPRSDARSRGRTRARQAGTRSRSAAGHQEGDRRDRREHEHDRGEVAERDRPSARARARAGASAACRTGSARRSAARTGSAAGSAAASDRGDASRERRPRQPLVDPDEQRDQHQRREVEEVALLDPLRPTGVTRTPTPRAGGRSRARRSPRGTAAGSRGRRFQSAKSTSIAANGNDADVEVELGDVVERATAATSAARSVSPATEYAPSRPSGDSPRTSCASSAATTQPAERSVQHPERAPGAERATGASGDRREERERLRTCQVRDDAAAEQERAAARASAARASARSTSTTARKIG